MVKDISGPPPSPPWADKQPKVAKRRNARSPLPVCPAVPWDRETYELAVDALGEVLYARRAALHALPFQYTEILRDFAATFAALAIARKAQRS
jgi:hypothetical protein